MTLTFGIKILAEVAAALLVIYGLIHEEEIAAYERAAAKALGKWIKQHKEELSHD